VIKIKFWTRLTKLFPNLKMKLIQAGMQDEPEYFVRKIFISTFVLSFGFVFVFLGSIFYKMQISMTLLLLIFPLTFLILFPYFLKVPDVKIMRSEKEVSREIVFAGRFLIVELESGVPISKAIENTGKNYRSIGRHFNEIIGKVNLGTQLEEAIADTVETTSSNDLRKILWQVLNSLKTGADVTKALGATIDQIAKEQQILVQEYGRKLNPIAMFYMMIAVIAPSLGITMLVIVSSFIGFKLDLMFFFALIAVIAVVQFLFLNIIKASRPPVDF
jgi:flagellar protein FlaJ